MKRILILSAFVLVITSAAAEARGHNYFVGDYFYTELAPYGRWIEIDYGVVVWQPTVMRISWLPYRVGRWIWTFDGWYWDSYEPFGYITYHYGRWYYDDYYGWLWYPDYEWAPAWVEWRYSNDYIGWAPLHPYATFSVSIGIHFTHTYYTPYYHWHFVSFKHFYSPYVYNYCVGNDYRYRIYNNTHYRTNYSYHNGRVQNRGIDFNYIKVRSGQEITQRDIIRVKDKRELNRNGDENQIRILDLKREDLVRNDLKRMEIQRDNRKTSLDLTKVEVNKRNITNTNKSTDRQTDLNKRNEVKISRNDKNQDLRKDEKVNDFDRKIDLKKGNDNYDRKTGTTDVNKRSKDKLKIETKRKNETFEKKDFDRTVNNRFDQNTKKEQVRTSSNNNSRSEVKVNRNNSVIKENVTRNKEQVQTQNNSGNRNEKKMQTNRTMVKDKSRERSKR